MIDLTKKKNTPAQLGFIGSITFLGSYVHESRVTRLMDFGTMVDWMRSCYEHFIQMVQAGDYDGSEIFVDIYEYEGHGDGTGFEFDFDKIVDQFVIDAG